jgi:hypothetical protein
MNTRSKKASHLNIPATGAEDNRRTPTRISTTPLKFILTGPHQRTEEIFQYRDADFKKQIESIINRREEEEQAKKASSPTPTKKFPGARLVIQRETEEKIEARLRRIMAKLARVQISISERLILCTQVEQRESQ